MRWAIAAVLFVIAIFGFFVGYAIGSLLITDIYTSLEPHGNQLTAGSATGYFNIATLLRAGFGIICAIVFVVITLIFIMDSLSEEPEYYWRR